jgi:hypothetical protein
MASDDRDSQIVALIQCGRAGDYRAVATKFARICPFDTKLLLLAAQQIHIWVDQHLITTDEISPLAKVLVVAENGGLFTAGSTHALCRVANLIGDIDLDWLYQHALNPYVPFGVDGRCRAMPSVDAYRKCEKLRRLERSLEKLQREVSLAKRRLAGSVRLDAMRKGQSDATKLRSNRIENMRTMPLNERLIAIANSSKPIHYYPEEFAVVPEGTVMDLQDECLVRLAEKLARAKKGSWRRLAEWLSR